MLNGVAKEADPSRVTVVADFSEDELPPNNNNYTSVGGITDIQTSELAKYFQGVKLVKNHASGAVPILLKLFGSLQGNS